MDVYVCVSAQVLFIHVCLYELYCLYVFVCTQAPVQVFQEQFKVKKGGGVTHLL